MNAGPWTKMLVLAGLCLLSSGLLHAAEPAWPWGPLAALTAEEREQMREQIRQQWQSKSPEERQRLRDEYRERRDTMSPEERQQLREQTRERWQQHSPEPRPDPRGRRND